MSEPKPTWTAPAALPEGFSVCRCCGGTISGWRYGPRGREPLGIDGMLHDCGARRYRNWRRRVGRAQRKALLEQRATVARRLHEEFSDVGH